MFSKLAFVSALFTLTFGAPVNVSPKAVHIPLHKEVSSLAAKNYTRESGHASRRDTSNQPLTYTGVRYYAEYAVGGQNIKSLLDTGSSDTFVFSSESGPDGYTPGESSDYHWLNNDFRAAYGDGSNQIAGTWFTDDLEIGGATIKNYEIALLNQSSPNFPGNIGILAIGPQAAETATPPYEPIYQRLKSDGVTESASYSLFTTDDKGSEASLLFGGVDTAKFDGPLYSIPFAFNEFTGKSYFSVDWQYKGVWYENGVLDTGTPFILINGDVAASIAQDYGAVWNENDGQYEVPSPDYSKPPLTITVGGVDIDIPTEYLYTNLEGVVVFGVQPNIQEIGNLLAMNILGDPFLRAVYSFYDIDNSNYYFAPIKVTSESNIVDVSGSVPNSQPAPNQAEGHTGNGNPGNSNLESEGIPGNEGIPGTQGSCVIC